MNPKKTLPLVFLLFGSCLADDGSSQRKLLANAAAGNLAIVRTLIAENSVEDVNCRDEAGNTPLMLAARNGHEPIVRYLVEHGAKASLRNNDGEDARSLALHGGYSAVAAILR